MPNLGRDEWLAHELRDLRAFITRQEAEGTASSCRQDLVAYSSGSSSLGVATVALGRLAAYEGAAGCLAVLTGNDGGFEAIDASCLYSYWKIRLLVAAYEIDPRPTKQPRIEMPVLATCWMHAAALQVRDVSDWLTERATRLTEGDQSIDGTNMSALCTLVAHLATGKGPRELERAGFGPLAPYEKIANRTLTPMDYDLLAEYHSEQARGGDAAAFFFYPYRLIPYELLAIERLTGVEIVDPRHPLLTSPLARRREVPSLAMVEELEAVIVRARSELSV
jgi:hypothetical protein